jgi:ArsR family metal-binding transcriptional regulator
MILGGSLVSDAVFKKILSIGFEFETGDISKLSLHSNKRTLINSDLSLRTLKIKTERGSIKIIDDNHLHVRIPIHKHGKTVESSERPLEEEEDEDMKEFLKELEDEWEEEYEDEQDEKAKQEKAELEKKENDSFLDYFNENRKSDNKETLKFQITNDLGATSFEDMVKTLCSKRTISKNEMYFFKTQKGKLYNIKFSEDIAKNDVCETFSGVEYVITYYKPKRENPNIIVDTFVDACSRIIDHLGNLKKTNGTLLLIDDKKTHYTPIGIIENERSLYRKPGTNLFYMDVYDDENTSKIKKLSDIEFIPQMTFRCKTVDAIDIIKKITEVYANFKVSKDLIRDEGYGFEELEFLEKIVNGLFEKYNSSAEKKVDLTTVTGKTVKTYIFFIIYKVYMFIRYHSKIFSKEDYLKDHLDFASRHPSYDLFKRLKEILKEKYGITAWADIKKLLYNAKLMEPLYESEENNSDDYEGEYGDVYKYNLDANIDELPKSDANFGNPLFSLSSYFDHFEVRSGDWLVKANHDVFTTTFSLSNDDFLIENRSFRYEAAIYLRNMVDKNISTQALTLGAMYKIVQKLYGSKMKDMKFLEWNPTKKMLVPKCKKGLVRNSRHDCVVPFARKKKVKKLSRSRVLQLKIKKTKKIKKTTLLKSKTTSRSKSKSKLASKSTSRTRTRTKSRAAVSTKAVA